MIKPILTDKKILSIVSVPAEFDEYTEQVINDLKDTANKLGNFAGLAAPQIDHKIRIILVNVQDVKTVMINPEYINKSGKHVSGNESCFSIPISLKKPIRVRRYYKIHIMYTDIKGNKITRRFKNFESRLIQHEIDHLNGKLIS